MLIYYIYMDVLVLYLSLCIIGYFVGGRLNKKDVKLKGASIVQTIALVALVFVMGSRIGAEDDIVKSLGTIGLKAFTITMFIFAGTVLAVFTARKFMGFDRKGNLLKVNVNVEDNAKASDSESLRTEAFKVDCIDDKDKSDHTMILCIFVPVTAGIVSGLLFIPEWFIEASGTMIVVGLSVLLFFVGVDLGTEGTIVQNFKAAGWRVILFPFIMILGTYLGAVCAGLIIGVSAKDALCIASGFGWYTLAPAMLAEYSIEISAISFMHNVMRELIGLLLLPIVAKKIGHIEATALVGAGSMDVCLPIIVKTTSGNMAVYAFIIGVVLSISVPVMVSFMMGL